MADDSRDSFDGAVAVVTGASAGVGWQTAKLLARNHIKIVAVARREERLRSLCAEIADDGGQAVCYAGDAALEQTAEAATSLALKEFGAVNLVICNAGVGNYKKLLDTSASEYDELMNNNMRSSFVFARSTLPHLIAQRSGTLLFVSSVAGLAGAANESVYCATKFAQVGFAQALDAELRPFGIKVGVICPGGIKTEFALGKGRTEASVRESPMLEPAEVAEAIYFACKQPANVRVVQMVVRNMGEISR